MGTSRENPSSAYAATVQCQNCGWVKVVQVKKGQLIKDIKCGNCDNKTLDAIAHVDMRDPWKPHSYKDA